MCPPKCNRYRNSQWEVEAIMLLKITAKLPTSPVKYDENWKHLVKLNLTDPDGGIPGYIDVLLGVDISSKVIRQGRWTGTPGTPSAIETSFRWVLSGNIKSECAPTSSYDWTQYVRLCNNHTTVLTRSSNVEPKPSPLTVISQSMLYTLYIISTSIQLH